MPFKSRLLAGTLFFLAVALTMHYLQNYRLETMVLDDLKKEEEGAKRSLQEQNSRLAEDRSRRHPVINLLEDSLSPEAPRFVWDNAKEEIIRKIAASTAASSVGAVEALEAALKEGRFDAAALLWLLRSDPELSGRLLVLMQEPRFSHLQESGYFSLGMIQDVRKVPELWRWLRHWKNEPRFQAAAARAIHKTIGSPLAVDELNRITRLEEESDQDELSAPELAAAALKDLGFEPPPSYKPAAPR